MKPNAPGAPPADQIGSSFNSGVGASGPVVGHSDQGGVLSSVKCHFPLRRAADALNNGGDQATAGAAKGEKGKFPVSIVAGCAGALALLALLVLLFMSWSRGSGK